MDRQTNYQPSSDQIEKRANIYYPPAIKQMESKSLSNISVRNSVYPGRASSFPYTNIGLFENADYDFSCDA